MASKRLLTSTVFQLERAAFRKSLHCTALLTSSQVSHRNTTFALRSRKCLRHLTTTRNLRLQDSHRSKTTGTTANTSSQDPNKAASAESTSTSTSTSTEPKIYTYDEIHQLVSAPDSASDSSPHPHPHLILIDVREPSELATTGRIPTALNVPITSSPDAFFLPETEFEERFGFPRPDHQDEVVFYCKSGVRSRTAAKLAAQAGFGGRRGEFPGSWREWEAKGGRVEWS